MICKCFYLVCPITCIHEIYISPFIYDVHNNTDTVVRIKGLESTMDTIKTTTCDVMDIESRIIMVNTMNSIVYI